MTHPKYAGCRITHQGNVLCCNIGKTFADNYAICRAALTMLLGEDPFVEQSDGWCDFRDLGGKVDHYHAYGGGE